MCIELHVRVCTVIVATMNANTLYSYFTHSFTRNRTHVGPTMLEKKPVCVLMKAIDAMLLLYRDVLDKKVDS